MRLQSAVTSSVWSPSTSSPIGSSTTISIRADSAESRVRASASLTTSSMSTRDSSGSPSAPVSRDSAISSVTRLPSRCASLTILAPNRRTSAGSSAASSTASASSPIAPDRCLELVADVGHEVASGGLQPDGVGGVGGLDQRVAVAERADLGEHGGGAAAALVERRQVDGDHRAALPHLRAGRDRAGVGLVADDDAELAGAGVGQHGDAAAVETTSPSSVVGKTRCRRSPSAGPGGATDGGTAPRPRPHRRPTAMPVASASAATSTQTTPVMASS